MRLSKFVDVYALSRDLAPATVENYRVAAQMYDRFSGGVLDDETVNRWIAYLADGQRSKHTIASRRRALLVLWRAAWEDGLAPQPGRIRRVKVPSTAKDVWTPEQIARLANQASKLCGWYQFGGSIVRRAPWWRSLVLSAWDTGLRWSDLQRIEFPVRGSFAIVQAKTGNEKTVHLRDSTLSAIRATTDDVPARSLVWPHWEKRDRFYRWFRSLVVSAELDGTFSKIRRSSITYVERETPGLGQIHAGHTSRATTEKWYLNRDVAYGGRRILPPEAK